MDAVLCERWEDLPQDGKKSLKAELDRIERAEKAGWVTFVPGGHHTLGELGDTVADIKPHVVIYDYVQRIKPDPGQRRWDAVSAAALLFQQMAVELNLLVLVTSQLKRRGDGALDKYKPPHLEDFKLASDIEEVSQVALGLYRPLIKMTAKDERAVRMGQKDLEDFKVRDTMGIKVLKHTFRGPAADQIIHVTHEAGRLKDKDRPAREPPLGRGDAWEGEEVPF
jgi:hypothetical protein